MKIKNYHVDTSFTISSGEDELVINHTDRHDVVRAVLDRNKALTGQKQHGKGMRMVASVPAVVHLQWEREYETKYRGKLTKSAFRRMKLNDFHHAKLRVDPHMKL